MAVAHPAKPTLGLLRHLTDEHVIRELAAEPLLTRAEIAARTGISKPTVSESIRRLVDEQIVLDTGRLTTGPGRAGTYFTLHPSLGTALVLELSPRGVIAAAGAVDALHALDDPTIISVPTPAKASALTSATRRAITHVSGHATGPTRVVLASAAAPVHSATGTLRHLPGSPFIADDVDLAAAIGEALPQVSAANVVIDNDVNWMARAECAARPELRNAAYLYLGEGIGLGVIIGGEVHRGATGLAGELAQVLTIGPSGATMPLVEAVRQLALTRPHSSAIDIERAQAQSREPGSDLIQALSGALSSLAAVLDPDTIVVAGPWATSATLTQLRRQLATMPLSPSVEPAIVGNGAAWAGLRASARSALLARILAPSDN